VEADGGFVQDVEDAFEVGAELCGKADALVFAAGEGADGAVELEVVEAGQGEEVEALEDFRQDVAGECGLASVEAEVLEPVAGGGDAEGGDVGDGVAGEANGAGDGVEACAVAVGAGCGVAVVAAVFCSGGFLCLGVVFVVEVDEVFEAAFEFEFAFECGF
jgi:hypothetical protein